MLAEKELLYRSLNTAGNNRDIVLKRYRLKIFIIVILLLGGFINSLLAEDNVVEDRIENPVRDAIKTRIKSQANQEEWYREKQKKTAIYERLKMENSQLRERQIRLEGSKKDLLERINNKARQLEQIKEISDQISPYLHEVLDRLNMFYQNDVPFLHDERSRRIDNLTKVLSEPDVTVSEKARKIMEALMVEAGYGHTIEVYRDTVDINGTGTLVDIFRFGRVALFYQTLDGRNCGFYNVAEKGWKPLPEIYSETIAAVMAIGAKRRPVELLSLPLGRLGS